LGSLQQAADDEIEPGERLDALIKEHKRAAA